MVFTRRQNIGFEFKVADWRHALIVVKGDVIAEVIERNWPVIVDRDVDLVRERSTTIVGPNGVCYSRRLKVLWSSRDGTGCCVEGEA